MKLIKLLQTFDNQQIKSFGRYLKSPYFCTDTLMEQLFSVLISTQLKKNTELDKEMTFKSLFGKIPYNDTRMRLLLSRLFKYAESFLVQEQQMLQSKTDLLLKSYRHKSLDKLFQETIASIDEEQKSQYPKNESFYDDQYLIAIEHYEYLVSKKRQGEFNLKDISDAMETAYIIKKLRHCCRVMHVHSVYKLETPFPFIDQILSFVSENKLYEIPVLGFYYYNYLSILFGAKDEYFQKCLSLHQLYENHFEQDERREIYLNLLNYCIRKVNEGQSQYNATVFELYMKGLEKDFLLDQGKLSRFTYRNIAEIGINLKEYDWVNSFLDRYQSKLEKNHQNSFYLLEKARVLSDQRNYHQAVALLANLSFDDHIIELSTRLERIRIFYEMEELELSQYHIESMEIYLRRKSNFGYHSEHYKAFIHFMRKILKQMNPNKLQWTALRKQIEQEEKLTGRKWLLEKVDQKILK